MSYSHGFGALATEAQLERGATPYANPATPGDASSGVPGLLVVGGLAVAGFLVYRHFKKGTRR